MAEIAVGSADGGDDAMVVMMPFCSDAADVCLTIDGGDLNYTSTSDIYGFQFDHDGCATGASGGDATSSGFIVQGGTTTVLGFSFSGGLYLLDQEHLFQSRLCFA